MINTWQKFAVELFSIEDADPGYMLLARADIKTAQRKRFMAAWCAFYNIGLAAQASEYKGTAFWGYLGSVYDTAKRASERRHFRGRAGRRALTIWEMMFPDPELFADHMRGDDYFKVRANAKTVPLIGDYFIFKWADVQERVFRNACAFPPEVARLSPKVPQQGALMIAPDQSVLETYNMIARHMNKQGMRSPPWYDRPMNMQEAETVACVYKQMMHGKWCPYSRTAKATKSLLATPCKTSELMLTALHSKTKVTRDIMAPWADGVLAGLGK